MVRDERYGTRDDRSIVAEIPKIVGQRLQAAAKAEVHLDPNLLAAFAEKSLGKREQLQVLEHLAQCSNCRDVVSLSIPQFQATTVVTTASGSSGWLSWPVLRWGALAACVIVVGTAVTLRHPKREPVESVIMARQTAAVTDAKPALEAQIAPNGGELSAKLASPQPPEAATNDIAASQPAKRLASRQANVGGFAGPQARGYLARAPAASGSLVGGAMFAKSATGGPAEQKSADSNLAEMAEARPNADLTELVPGRAKDALEEESRTAKAKTATGATSTPQAMNEASLLATPNLMPRWTLSADGTLQRSLDSGRTWKTIPVSNRTIFRALAANGLDIWVGGSGGALYHSSDAGEHWLRVQPVANGESLTADIIGVEFTDPLHGKLTTSSQGSWTTADSGKTWQKQ